MGKGEDWQALVPKEWKIEQYSKDPKLTFLVIITKAYPNPGSVTLDFEKRGFRGGVVTTGKLTSTRRYIGHGWKKVLVRDAIAWLESL